MKKLRTALFVFTAVLLGGLSVARAQICEAQYEVIVTLRPPDLGMPTVWDATYGKYDTLVQLYSGLTKDEGTVFAAGRKLLKGDFKPLSTVLVELNRRGRVLTEKEYPMRDGEVPVKMIALGKGYLVASNMIGGKKNSRQLVRLAWYNTKGDFVREKILKDAEFDISSLGLVAAADGNGFVVLVHAVNFETPMDEHGALMRFSDAGQLLWRRAYRPGIPNFISGLKAIDNKSYLATGSIRMDDGRMAGWIMKLAFDGTVMWQRTYPRGASAGLYRGTLAGKQGPEERGFLVLGNSTPLGRDKPSAVWLMAINPLGEPLWQRYFRRKDFSFSAVGLRGNEDGRITVVMNAESVISEEDLERLTAQEKIEREEGIGSRNHVRILTLSPRGVLIEDESYIEGLHAEAKDFVEGWNGERIVVSTIQSDSRPPPIEELLIQTGKSSTKAEEEAMKEPPVPDPTLEGWVFVATALDPYEDPCQSRKKR